jgi:hypothetical protein
LSQDADDGVEAVLDEALGLIEEEGIEVLDSAFD